MCVPAVKGLESQTNRFHREAGEAWEALGRVAKDRAKEDSRTRRNCLGWALPPNLKRA